MLASHLLPPVALVALFCFSVVQSSQAHMKNVSVMTVPPSKTATSILPKNVPIPAERIPEDDRLLTVDLVARARGKAASDRFDSPLVRSRVNIDVRQKVLSEVIGVRVNIQPFRKDLFLLSHLCKIKIARPFVLHPSSQPVVYFDEKNNRHYRTSLVPFFYSVAPAHHDAHAAYGIPVDQVDVIELASVPLWFDVSIDLQRVARAMREQTMRSRFLPIPHRPLAATTSEAMISYCLRLPTGVSFHPSTFSHRLLDLGDVVKIIAIYCIRQGVNFIELCECILPFASIGLLESDPIKDGRHILRKDSEDPSDKDASGYFIQVLSAQPFRLIKASTSCMCLQECNALVSKDAPWPPLRMAKTGIPRILLARYHDFVSNPSEQPFIAYAMSFSKLETMDKEVIAESMQAAEEVWIDVDIPASTLDSSKMFKSIVALRRLSVDYPAMLNI
jgi:hypothetical protein